MPKSIENSGKEIVAAVRHFCERERANKGPLIPFANVRQRVAALTGVSEKTVSIMTKKAFPSKASTEITVRDKREEKKVKVDNFDSYAIRKKIYETYVVRKELPSLKQLLAELQRDINFKKGRTTLWKIITEIGFLFKKCRSKRRLLLERHDIVAWRQRYLHNVREKRNEGRPIVYLGETYIPAIFEKTGLVITNEEEEEALTGDTVRERWIILHAGGEMGFIPNAQLILKSQSKSGDIHEDISEKVFMTWLKEKLIPNLPPYSLIVIDNAPYNTVPVIKSPTLSSTKSDMQDWMTKKGLAYTPNMLKAQLYEIIKEHKKAPVYKADQLLERHGHNVARLPPYHSELNLIYFMWSHLKRLLAGKNVGKGGPNFIKLAEENIQSITEEDWQMQCENVQDIEENFSEMDDCMDAAVDRLNSAKPQKSKKSDSF